MERVTGTGEQGSENSWVLPLRKVSRLPFSISSVMIQYGADAVQTANREIRWRWRRLFRIWTSLWNSRWFSSESERHRGRIEWNTIWGSAGGSLHWLEGCWLVSGWLRTLLLTLSGWLCSLELTLFSCLLTRFFTDRSWLHHMVQLRQSYYEYNQVWIVWVMSIRSCLGVYKILPPGGEVCVATPSHLSFKSSLKIQCVILK